jgi:sterol desaturase/sphingolipid hydroxylase (fatty acid hydroxylase superfamily)
VFSFWDRLFGSANAKARWPAMTIGVEGEEERDLPGLILRPIQPGRPSA